jgi:hypothetical protein
MFALIGGPSFVTGETSLVRYNWTLVYHWWQDSYTPITYFLEPTSPRARFTLPLGLS